MAGDRPQRVRRAPSRPGEQTEGDGAAAKARTARKSSKKAPKKAPSGSTRGRLASGTVNRAALASVSTQNTANRQQALPLSSPPPVEPPRIDLTVESTLPLSSPTTPRAREPLRPPLLGLSSSPGSRAEFDLEVDYKLIVNGKSAVHRPPERHGRYFWWLDMAEKVINDMLEQPEAQLSGREFDFESRTVAFRAGVKSRKILVTLADFSQVEEDKLFKAIEYQVSKSPGVQLVEVTFEVRVKAKALEKAFKRNQSFNDPSSDVGEVTPQPEKQTRRQQQLLNESRAIQRVESLSSAQDWERSLHQHWLCRNSECTNFGNWCWVTPNHEHYAIGAADSKSWANAIVAGQAELLAPPITLIDYWRSPAGGGNQLKRRRGAGKKRSKARRGGYYSDSESDGSDGEGDFWRNYERRERQKERQRAIDEARWRDKKHELLKLQRESVQLQQNTVGFGQPVVPMAPQIGYPAYSIPPALPSQLQQLQQYYSPLPSQRPRTPGSALPIVSSSPVSGQEDTRATVREFFSWLINQQPEDDREDYEQARDVAISEKWTVKDLKEMSSVRGELYKIAVSERFKLKDGVVRHLRDDLKKYKQHCKTATAAAGFVSMGSRGAVGSGVTG